MNLKGTKKMNHKKMLEMGVDHWSAWRRNSIGTMANFRGVNLAGKKFSQVDFSQCDFRGSYLYGSIFEDCRFTKTNFSGANLRCGVFTGSHFNQCEFRSTFALHSNWTGCTLNRCDIDQAQFTGSNFSNANILYGYCHESTFHRSKFVDVTIKGVQIIDCNIHRADFTNANLVGVHWAGSSLARSTMKDVYVKDNQFCNFIGDGILWKTIVLDGQYVLITPDEIGFGSQLFSVDELNRLDMFSPISGFWEGYGELICTIQNYKGPTGKV